MLLSPVQAPVTAVSGETGVQGQFDIPELAGQAHPADCPHHSELPALLESGSAHAGALAIPLGDEEIVDVADVEHVSLGEVKMSVANRRQHIQHTEAHCARSK
mmetsp:Transcript_41890/g.82227  ORF Transcript_41890/g.82227 Transcript_41890/m.82227 type:complete len:103 (-) Transcript_41890:876-1184(-)